MNSDCILMVSDISVYTEYNSTDDIVTYQSIEKIEWLEYGRKDSLG